MGNIWKKAVHLFASDDALVVIDNVHAKGHAGYHFEASYKAPEGSPIGVGATVAFLIHTMDAEVHLTWEAQGEAEGEMEFYMDTEVSDGGEPVTIWNRNHNSNYACKTLITRDPTVTVAGRLIANHVLPGGSGGNASGGSLNHDTERILKPNTNYLARATNRSTGTQHMSIGVDFYEEAD